WGDTPVPDGQVSAIYDSSGSLVADAYHNATLFKVYVDPADNNTIVAQVAVSLLKDSANADKWVYLVAVASYDGYGYMKVRTAQPGDPGQWVLGGADPKAVLAGVQPLAIDIVAPTAQDQYRMLSSYDTATGKFAVVYGVNLKGELVSPTPPPTMPSVPITTVTLTQSTTTTVTQTATQTATETSTTTYTTTTYVTTYDYTPTMAIGGVLVVIALGLLAGILRKK
ncbi:glucodextranase DOMON-like domain-containing protein, partial [Thermogladius sp.]|uniref:glucodextranase DOMON-like domain-containing protein n=1 Tax=Thermogladius sp. TaxID=2023064 RepID=UPI003D09F0A7